MPEATTTSVATPKRRRNVRGRVVLYGFLLLLTGLTFAYIRLTESHRVAQVAKDALTKMTGADVRIGGAAFEINGIIRLFDVEMRIPNVPGSPVNGDRLFTADQVLIQHNIWALATGGLDVESISLIRPTFFPTEDCDAKKFTVQYLKPKSSPKKKEKTKSIDLPDVHLSQALIVFGEIVDGKYHPLETVQLNGDLTRQPKETGAYSFALRQTRGDRQFVLSGDFDLYHEVMDARMQLGSLTADDRRIAMLPRQVRNIFQRLKPAGSFPAIRFGYDKERKFNAVVEIADGGVNVPWGQTELYIEKTRGTVSIENNNQLAVDLKGQAWGSTYGADYSIKGRADGFEPDAAFDVDVTLAGTIGEKPDDYDLLPREMKTLYKEFSPRGKFEASVNLQRDAASGTLLTHGSLRLIDAAITADKFKYALQNVNGTVSFDNEHVKVNNLTALGKPDEFGRRAKVNISGDIIGLGGRPGVNIVILAENAPVDQSLYEALDPKDERQIFDMFFSKPHHARYTDEKTGTLQTSRQKAQRHDELDALSTKLKQMQAASPRDDKSIAETQARVDELTQLIARPVFDLGGIAKCRVDVTVKPGERRQSTIIRATAPGLQIAYENWPFPLHILDGELLINLPAVNGEVVRVVGHAKGLNGGLIDITGIMKPPLERGRMLIPDIKLTAKQIPLDELLLLSLPEKDAKVVRNLNLEGAIDIDGKIFNDENHKIDFRIGVALNDGKATPNRGGYELSDVDAKLTIHRRGVDINSVDARHGDSTLNVASVPAADGKSSTLVLTGTKMKFTDPVLDLVPGDATDAVKQVRQLLSDYQPAGIFDFKLTNISFTGGKTEYQLDVSPRNLSFTLKGQRIDISDFRGAARVTPSEVKLDNIRGDFGTGRFRVDGTFDNGKRAGYDLAFDIEAGSFCKVTRTLLPSGAINAIDSLKLEGGYGLRSAKLIHDPTATDKPTTRFDAIVRLDDAKATVGVPITQLNGDVVISVTEQKPGDQPAISLQLDRVRLRAAERYIDPVSLRIASGDKPGVYHITKLKGEMYGGTLTGSGTVFRQDKTDKYKMEIALQEVSLDAFVAPTDPKHQPPSPSVRRDDVRLIGDLPREGDSAPQPATQPRNEPVVRKKGGLLSASLAIEGDAHDANTKRGRGDLRVRDAAIYETKLGIALLQILNLGAPDFKSFDKVEATYILDGDTVHMDRIHFDSPSLTISGKGKMKYSTQELDLQMTSANPRGIKLGPVTDVLNMLKDELVSIRVTGTLTEPKAGVQTLKGITGAVDEVLGGKPKETTRKPIPPVRE